jgi:hypothetical protein
MDVERIQRFINAAHWKYAKTMPQWPHWYCLKEKVNPDEFVWFCKQIFTFGKREAFKAFRHHPIYRMYLYFKEYKYWIMSNPKDAILINRTFHDHHPLENERIDVEPIKPTADKGQDV